MMTAQTFGRIILIMAVALPIATLLFIVSSPNF
ncbi:hypothetical protein PHIM19_10 [Sinorhizobium phage phiM19]|nr:hypothetical protein PHIM19_10 [Sinorhizobium phage phiM19]